ncbi:MAG TPA: energy transducer TonB, partial [Thermomonas sp.]|nr:energy transducer TonB [Thermomonas sp.]
MKKAVLIALALAAGSGAQAQDRVRVVNEGGIRGDWTLAPGTQLSAPGYPGAFAKTGDDVCVAVGYRIQPDGSTSDFSLLKTWSSRSGEGEAVEGYWDAFSQAAVAALQQWKFAPRPEVGKPTSVDTVATMTFTGLQSVDA